MLNRIFIATEFFQPLTTALQAIQTEWHQQMKDTRVRWVRPDCMHLTFHFLGDISTTQVILLPALLSETLSGLSTKRVFLANLTAFPTTQRATVLVCMVEDSPERLLDQIHNRLTGMLTKQGIRVDERTWRPHLTLGRLPVPAPVSTLWYRHEPLAWYITNVSLVSSTLELDGPIYRTLHVIPLEK